MRKLITVIILYWLKSERKGLLLYKSINMKIFHHTVIDTCFEMLKSSEHEKLCRYSNYEPPILKIVLKLISWSPNLILLLDSKNRGHWVEIMSTLYTPYNTKFEIGK